jgi:hypothetical protein
MCVCVCVCVCVRARARASENSPECCISLPSVYVANKHCVLGRVSKNSLRNNYFWAQSSYLEERMSMNAEVTV